MEENVGIVRNGKMFKGVFCKYYPLCFFWFITINIMAKGDEGDPTAPTPFV